MTTAADSNPRSRWLGLYLVFASVVLLAAIGCEDKSRTAAQKAANIEKRKSQVASYVASGARVVSQADLDDGSLRVIEIPKRSATGTMVEVQTCLLFVHRSGASSIDCADDSRFVFGNDLPPAEP